MKVTLFDYGAGNIHSLAKALARGGAQVRIEPDPRQCTEGDALVLPGVGAFSPAADRLRAGREWMRDAIEGGFPCLGICLGMQLFFESSEEGEGQGLGLFRGRVQRLRSGRIPHIGWNTLERASDSLLTTAVLQRVYYAHSYVCRPPSDAAVTAWSRHGEEEFPAAIRSGSAVGVQFHPEKSSAAGLAFIRAFLEEARR